MKSRKSCGPDSCGTNRVFGPLGLFSADMENLLSNVFVETPAKASSLRPRANIAESDTQFLIRLELPGVAGEDVSVEVHEGKLSVRGNRKVDLPEDGTHKWLRQEFNGGPFERQFEFHQLVDLDKVEASFADGVLQIVVPKSEKAKPRSIEIRTA